MPSKTVADEVLWLARHRKEDAWILVRNFKRLTRGRRGELGPVAATFISNLEFALKDEQKRLRAATRKKSKSKSKLKVEK
jgi:hypothetical protein